MTSILQLEGVEVEDLDRFICSKLQAWLNFRTP
jgi:hypothetical protein